MIFLGTKHSIATAVTLFFATCWNGVNAQGLTPFECDISPNALTNVLGTNVTHMCIPANEIIDGPDQGQERCYYLYVPECARGSVPLVFDNHGSNSCPAHLATHSGWFEKSNQECFAVVWPVGHFNRTFDTQCWNVPGGIRGLEPGGPNQTTLPCCCTKALLPAPRDPRLDVYFLRHLAGVVVTRVPQLTNNVVSVDVTRIYMSGHSNGCFLSMAMAMQHSDMVAATCCMSAAWSTPPASNYRARPITVIRGGLDTTVPTNGWSIPGLGLVFASANASFEGLARLNNCRSVTDSRMALPEMDLPERPGYLITQMADDCDNNATIQYQTLNNGGHLLFPKLLPPRFPSSAANTSGVNLTDLAWNFCSRHVHDNVAPSLLSLVAAVSENNNGTMRIATESPTPSPTNGTIIIEPRSSSSTFKPMTMSAWILQPMFFVVTTLVGWMLW